MSTSRTIQYSDAGIPVMLLPEVPYAYLSSALTQGVVSATVAYPMVFESTDEILGMYRQSGSFTCNLASPVTITWTNHKLAIGEAVVFSRLTDATGITEGTVYYISASNFTTNTFELSTTFGGASDVNTSASGSGTVTCVSRLYVNESGKYQFILSTLFGTISNVNSSMNSWLIKGNKTSDLVGTIIPKTNTYSSFSYNLGISEQIHSVTLFILDMLIDDFIHFNYCGSNDQAVWLAIAAQSNPTRPATSSVILVANKISS